MSATAWSLLHYPCQAARSVQEILESIHYGRTFTLVDYGYSCTLRAVNSVAAKVWDAPIATEESMKTIGQKKREAKILSYRERLGYNTPYPDFCRQTAAFIDAFVPHLIGEKLETLPASLEVLLLFYLGLPTRYVNYQVNKKTAYRDLLINSDFGVCAQGYYKGLRTQLAHTLLAGHNLKPLISFEALLLKTFLKLVDAAKGDGPGNCLNIFLKCMGNTLSKQKELERTIRSLDLSTDAEKFIARLDWHKRHGSLPKGLPDPQKIGLTPDNLEEKLDDTLQKSMEGLVRTLLEHAPFGHKYDFFGVVYALEGKDLLVDILSFLSSEFGVKQLSDPHLFALAILSAGGQEVADYELDGFGRGKREKIIDVGQDILLESLNGERSWSDINALYEKAELKASPKSLEGILQRKEAKEKLKTFIASLIYDLIKKDDFKNGGVLKGVRERASRLPVVGVATISLHCLINGLFFSLKYLFRSKRQAQTRFLTWMVKNFWGNGFCHTLADRIVDLIYHPSLKVILMQTIDGIQNMLDGKEERGRQTLSVDDVKPTLDFLFQHFSKDSSLPLEASVAPLLDYFFDANTLEQFKQMVRPTEGSPIDKILESLIPTVKEQLLVCRFIDAFRKECVSFPDDGKFWEVFLRESLNRLVAHEVSLNFAPPTKPELADLAAFRTAVVDRCLALEVSELREFLIDIPQHEHLQRQWEIVPQVPECTVRVAPEGFDFCDAMEWNYIH